MPDREWWKTTAARRARSLQALIVNDAPDVLIGNMWHMLWEAMANAYGEKVFEGADEFRAKLKDEIDNSN